jgi:hypothetical protein
MQIVSGQAHLNRKLVALAVLIFSGYALTHFWRSGSWSAGTRRVATDTRASQGVNRSAVDNCLKGLCLQIVGKIGSFLEETSGDKPIRTVEAYLFGIFLAAEAYSLASRTGGGTSPVFDGFRLNMCDYLLREEFEEERNSKGQRWAEASRESIGRLAIERCNEYGPLLSEFIEKRDLEMRGLLCALAGHLFAEPLPSELKSKLLPAAAERVAVTFLVCVETIEAIDSKTA